MLWLASLGGDSDADRARDFACVAAVSGAAAVAVVDIVVAANDAASDSATSVGLPPLSAALSPHRHVIQSPRWRWPTQ